MVFTHFHMYLALKVFLFIYFVGCGGAQMKLPDMLHGYVYEPINDKGNNLSLTCRRSYRWFMVELGRNL